MSAKALAALFLSLDVDRNNQVDRDELYNKLISDNEIQEQLNAAGGLGSCFVFEQIDSDQNKDISFQEFISTLSAPSTSYKLADGRRLKLRQLELEAELYMVKKERDQLSADVKEQVDQFFQSVDQDHNGVISKEEMLMHFFDQLEVGDVVTEEHKMLLEKFERKDSDSDGKITKEEMISHNKKRFYLD